MKGAYTVGSIFQCFDIGGRKLGIRPFDFLRWHPQAIRADPNTIKSPGQSLKGLISLSSDGIQNRPDPFFNFGVLVGSPMTHVFHCLRKPPVFV
jgi:hypothetical protein